MNAISPVEKFRQQVLPADKATDLWRSLPAHIKPAVFERNLVNAIMQNPSLMEFHPGLVYREVSKAAGLGLLLDPQLGEAYMVVAWNGKTKRKEPQLRIGYKGMCKLARQAGDVTNIYAHEVCAKDKIECHLGAEKKLIHVPDVFGDRGDVVGYYAVIKYADGSFDFEPMTVKQCREIRDRSDAWKAYTEKRIVSTPWATDEGEMSKKTVLRRLLKRQAQSPELAEAIRLEDEAEFMEAQTVQRVARDSEPPLPPPTSPAIAHHPQPAPTAATEPDIIDAEVVPPTDPSDPGPMPDLLERNDGPETAIDEVQWLRDLDGALSSCEDVVSLGQKQNNVMKPMRSTVSVESWKKAEAMMREHFQRISTAGETG